VILLVGHLRDALFGFVLIANTLIGVVQELRAKRTLDRLSVLTAPTARVLRDGVEREVAVAHVVRTTSSSWVRETRSSSTARFFTPRGWRSTNPLLTGESP
jgi:cation-transporting ATPase E